MTAMTDETWAVCGCRLLRSGEYGKPTKQGRSDAIRHHFVGELFAAGMLAAASTACAEPLRPVPQPKIGAACPSGYQSSGGACIPGPNTKCRAFPSTSSTCPSGYTKSFDYCVETGCQSR